VARHRRLAGLLADRPETAAGHAAAAGDWTAAARAWMAAAATAARSYANRDAERLLGQAVEAATRAVDPALEAAARLDRGRVLVALGDYPGAAADQERALELATGQGDGRLEAAALEQLGWTAYYNRDAQAASELTPQALELAERAVAARRAGPTALLLAGRARHAEGDLAGAQAAFDVVLADQPDLATETVGLTYLGLLLEHSDRFAEARRTLDRSIAGSRAAGLFRPLLTSCFAATLACANLGDLRGALDHLAMLERLLAEARTASTTPGRPPPAPGSGASWATSAGPVSWPTAPSTCSARPPAAPTRASTPSSPWPRPPWSPATTPRPSGCWTGPAASRPPLRLPLAGRAAPRRAGQPPRPAGRGGPAGAGQDPRLGQVPGPGPGPPRPPRRGHPDRRPGRLRLPAGPGRPARPGPGRDRPHRRRPPARPAPAFLARGQLVVALGPA
jgi:tetratricopeptide (TPR) repeat protein